MKNAINIVLTLLVAVTCLTFSSNGYCQEKDRGILGNLYEGAKEKVGEAVEAGKEYGKEKLEEKKQELVEAAKKEIDDSFGGISSFWDTHTPPWKLFSGTTKVGGIAFFVLFWLFLFIASKKGQKPIVFSTLLVSLAGSRIASFCLEWAFWRNEVAIEWSLIGLVPVFLGLTYVRAKPLLAVWPHGKAAIWEHLKTGKMPEGIPVPGVPGPGIPGVPAPGVPAPGVPAPGAGGAFTLGPCPRCNRPNTHHNGVCIYCGIVGAAVPAAGLMRVRTALDEEETSRVAAITALLEE
jgi:hypothetical protein